jgi:peptidyl-prolyl cis-trans isomerase-like 4
MAVAPSLEPTPEGNGSKGGAGSQFFITLADNIEYLDGKHSVFGHVVEGFDTLDKLNEMFVDQDNRPFKDVRIRHVIILDDPFPDPPGLVVPENEPTKPQDNSTRIAEDEDPLAELPEEEEERIRREKAAAASALTLEMVGDLPFANVRPPENVLFVCKLNPVTRDEDLELIFSRFGTIMSCQVIRDKKTGDSLQYAFIEFDKREDAEQAYFKMQNVLVDDRRIWVDLWVTPLPINLPFLLNSYFIAHSLWQDLIRIGLMILCLLNDDAMLGLEAERIWNGPESIGMTNIGNDMVGMVWYLM